MPVTGKTTVFEVSAILFLHISGVAGLRDRGKKSRFGSCCIFDLHTRGALAYFLYFRAFDLLQSLCHTAHTRPTMHAVNSQSKRVQYIPPSPIICASLSGRFFLLFARWHEAVADAAYRLQIRRISGFVLDITSQPDDKVVDCASICVLPHAPYLLQELFTGDDAALITHEVAQKIRLHQRQVDMLLWRCEFQ